MEAPAAGVLSSMLQAFEDQDSNFHDCVIRSEDGAAYKCHRVILCGGSCVFRAAFNSSMQEAQQRAMTIAADAAVLKLLLAYIYGATTLEVPVAHLVPLLQLADQYQLPKLHHVACIAVSQCSYTPAAAYHVMRQALHHGSSELVEAILPQLLLAGHSSAAGAAISAWREQDVALLLCASRSSYPAVRTAMTWASMKLQCPPEAVQPGGVTAPSVDGHGAASGGPSTSGAAAAERQPAAAQQARSPAGCSSASGAGGRQQGCAGAGDRADDPAAQQQVAAVHPAWEAAFLPLMTFRGLKPAELRELRSCPGSGSVPQLRLMQMLLQGWESGGEAEGPPRRKRKREVNEAGCRRHVRAGGPPAPRRSSSSSSSSSDSGSSSLDDDESEDDDDDY